MMQKIATLLLLLLPFTFRAGAQPLREKELTGTWEVISIPALSKEIEQDAQVMNLAKKYFISSKFMFKDGHLFSFDITDEAMRIKKGLWQFNPAKQLISVYEWKDKGKGSLLMEVTPRRNGTKTLFIVKEVGTFEVKKK